MSAFPNQHLPFVLNSFVEPNTVNSMSGLLREESIGTLETCFSSSFPDSCFQEIPRNYSQNHGAITIDEANLLVPFKFNFNASATVKLATNSTALPMTTVELEGRGDHQLITAKVSASEKKRKKEETKFDDQVEREKKREKQGNKVRGVEKAKESTLKPDVKKKKVAEKVETDNYVHVRARRGEATDKHSLAERVRRAKISTRMKLLQSLVPGCDNITGKTRILDEIIRYVQFLQRQVESFAAKFASIDSAFAEFGAGLSNSTLPLEEFSSLELPLPHNHLEFSSTAQLTVPTASASSLLHQPDRHQRLNITTQDQNNMLWGMQFQNQKLVEEQYGLDTTLNSS